MTNAVFTTSPITKEAGEKVDKFRLVELSDGKVIHATGDSLPYGYIRQPAAPQAREENDLSYGLPHLVAVVTHQAVVEVEVATGATFTPGAAVYAAADGKVSNTGTVAIGLAEGEVRGSRVRVHLFHPAGMLTGAAADEPAAG